MSSRSLLHANDRDGEYPPSWYAATARNAPDLAPLKGDTRCDVAVVGAGYTGLSCALHLARGGYDVVVLEAHRVGWGASGRNGGQVGTGLRVDQDELEQWVGHGPALAAWDMAEESKGLVKSLVREHDIPCDFTPGVIYANHRRRFDRRSRHYAEFLNQHYGYDSIRYVAPDEMRHLVGSDACSGGTLDTGAGHLHPLNYALGMANAALGAGVRIHEQTEVTGVRHGDPVSVATARGNVRADYLVYAGNGYLGGLERAIARHVMPINNYMIATEPLGEARARRLISNNAAVADSRFVVNYFRLSPDHRLLFGGGESYGYRFPGDIRAMVRKHMLKIYPGLGDVNIDYGWGGTLAITMKRLPYFYRPADNVVSAGGYSGSGIALATGSGAVLAQAIDGVMTRFDVMSALPTPGFPGGALTRAPLLALAMTWYALRDRL